MLWLVQYLYWQLLASEEVVRPVELVS